jgi:hypothetical protein
VQGELGAQQRKGRDRIVAELQYRRIGIDSLLLNTRNPRLDPVGHQDEAIRAMLEDQQDKLLTLAKHMMDNGLNPIDPILVKPYGERWVVREGNRRIVALKLVNEPALVPTSHVKLRERFEELNVLADSELLFNVNCVILEDEEKINVWVGLKHTGENEGAGTVSWDGTQTSRFRTIVEKKRDMMLEFLDHLRTLPEVGSDLKASLSSIKKTNFDRLMGDPYARQRLGLDVKDRCLVFCAGVSDCLLLVLHDLACSEFSVGRIYTKADRRKYVESVVSQVESANAGARGLSPVESASAASCSGDDEDENPGGEGNSARSENVSDTSVGSSGTAPPKSSPSACVGTHRKVSHHANRKALVPGNHTLSIGHARIHKIFLELKKLDLRMYPNAGAVLFRTFIELSCDCYIERHGLAKKKLNPNSKLYSKIDAIAKDLKASGVMTDNGLRPISLMTSSDTHTQSVRTFNHYVHNKDVTPVVSDLISAWDDVWPFVQKTWGNS